MHLVVSGSGQLGTVLVRQLVAAGKPVRAFVRPMSQYQHLVGSGAELAFGDLRDAGIVRAAMAGADTSRLALRRSTSDRSYLARPGPDVGDDGRRNTGR
jgi:uncharacterized protein YbjT (DUF2867 family)